MKKLLFATLLAAFAISTGFGQANAYWYKSGSTNYKAKLTQVPISANESYMFPSTDVQEKNYDNDTITVTVTQLETFVDLDSISGTTYVILSPSSYVLAGAKVFLHAEWDGTSASTVYVKQGSTVVDTIIVGDYRVDVEYVHNGTSFIRATKASFPKYVGTVTQASSITTGVTLNADAGIITTVSSTIAADDSSASFTLTNSFIKATSVIQLQCLTAGNGAPYAQITSVSAGSAVIKIFNLSRLAALNNTIKIHFLILNK